MYISAEVFYRLSLNRAILPDLARDRSNVHPPSPKPTRGAPASRRQSRMRDP